MAEMLAEPGSPHNVLLHLLAQEAPEPLSEHELWAQIKRVTPWSLSTLRGILVELQARSLVRRGGGGWTVGGEFEPLADEVAAAVADKIAGRHNKPAIGHKINARYEAVLNILNRHDRTSIATSQLLNELGDITNLRTLQRDLVQLEKQGLVSRNDEGWFSGRVMSDEMFEDRARAVALKLMVESFEGAVPVEIQKSLRKPLANAKKKLEMLTSSDPRIRWLSALRIRPSQHPLGDPIIDPDVQVAVEESILNKTKIEIRWSARDWTMRTSKSRCETGSISHYLLELPLRPAIAFWPDADESGRSVRIQVEDIESATVSSQAASWPNGYEPVLVPGQMGFQTGDASANNGRSLVVLRVSAETVIYLQN